MYFDCTFWKSQKSILCKKKPSVLIARISSRRRQRIANPTRYTVLNTSHHQSCVWVPRTPRWRQSNGGICLAFLRTPQGWGKRLAPFPLCWGGLTPSLSLVTPTGCIVYIIFIPELRARASGAPYLRKIGSLSIPEILVITLPYAPTTGKPMWNIKLSSQCGSL